MVEFSRNWVIKLYCALILFFLISIAVGDGPSSGGMFEFLLIFVVLFFAIRVFTDKVIIERHKVTSKTLFGEKSIIINPNSLIFIKRNSFSFNFILRINSYNIRIENSPNDILKINADVQDVDELFGCIQNLEQELITPKVVDTFATHGAIQMKNLIYISQDGFKVGGKAFSYGKIKGVKIKEGNFVVYGEGRMWDRALLTKPVYDIPNLQTNLMLLSQFTSVA